MRSFHHFNSEMEGNLSNGTFENPLLGRSEETFGEVFFVLLFVCVIENPFIVYIIQRTAGLKASVRALLINECVAETVMELMLIVYIITDKLDALDANTTKKYIVAISSGLFGVVIHSLSAISFNMHLAICHGIVFQRQVTLKRVGIFLVLTWVLNLSISLLTLVSDQSRIGMYPNYSGASACLWVVLNFNTHLLPFCVTVFSFIKITLHLKKTQPTMLTRPGSRDKIVLSRLITCLSIYYVAASFMGHLLKSLYLNTAIQQHMVHGVWNVFVGALYLYHVLRLPFYMFVYKPFRQTVRGIFGWGAPCAGGVTMPGQPVDVHIQRRHSRW